LFSPNISKESFGGFVVFQGVARLPNQKVRFQIFSSLWPLFGIIPDAVPPHFAVSHHMGPSAFNGWRGFTVQLGGACVHSGAVIRIERIFNLADIPIVGKRLPSFFRTRLKPDFAFETKRRRHAV
jgi:hypothetical protein